MEFGICLGRLEQLEIRIICVMFLSDFDYKLPVELIAQHPATKRDYSRLLILDRKTGKVDHHTFYDVIKFLKPGDLFILNNSKVFPARLVGKRTDTGGKIELLLDHQTESGGWMAIGKGLKQNIEIEFENSKMRAKVEEKKYDEFILSFNYAGPKFWREIEKIGLIPLPPYIKRPAKDSAEDKERYQTVYAERIGSVAAPTAGLHFTPKLLKSVQKAGVRVQFLTLHVGLGTFLPVKTDRIEDHKMHQEYFELDKKLLDEIRQTKENGGRVIAVGTTTTRVLEAMFSNQAVILFEDKNIISGRTKIFIYPGFKFKCVDGLITNFHLPKSTLLMLVSAFAGRKNILNAYETAISKKYRFFSYGDAMLIK